jgi:glutamyl-tRNA synthetase
MTKIKTRFAPSPTGSLHIGGIRTALYSYALAKSKKGTFILRIEDTDQKRFVKGSQKQIEDALSTLGLNWDKKYIQSKRKAQGIYQKAADKLVQNGHAFYCDCKPQKAHKDGKFSKELRDPCRDKALKKGAIKLKVPDNETISFKDYVIGKEISWNSSTIKDPVLLKSDGFPTYHLAVVVDDHDMGITHVLRGYDWLPSTPIHLLIYKYLALSIPQIGHLTDILDPSGGKLSKRKGSVSFKDLTQKEGILPEALLNFVMLLGWAPKNNQEIFSLSQFVKVFDQKGLQKANPIFNPEKLDWFNSKYIQSLSSQDLAKALKPFVSKNIPSNSLLKIAPLISTRIKRLSQASSLTDFFAKPPKVSSKSLSPNHKKHLQVAINALSPISPWTLKDLNDALIKEIKNNSFSTAKFFMDLRIAITGQKITPPINDSMVILGKEETLKRIKNLS